MMKAKNSINDIIQSGLFRDIDIHFARFVTRLHGRSDPDIYLGAALVSFVTGNGDVCLDLKAAADQSLPDTGETGPGFHLPLFKDWMEKFLTSPVAGDPGDPCPLILDQTGKLYLTRYHVYEQSLIHGIKEKVQHDIDDLDLSLLSKRLDHLFLKGSESEPNWQKIAAAVAAMKRFCVISGGPGTGKTYTVARILAILLDLSPLRIALTAPTGKAAARLTESIEDAKQTLDIPSALSDQIPSEGLTVHRLLQPRFRTPEFHHDADHPLPVDVVVVDEASMIDLALMAKLISAIPPDARLILLGDKDQLASVEAGSILGDISGGDRPSVLFSRRFSSRVSSVTGEAVNLFQPQDDRPEILHDAIVVLKKSHRFDAESDIGAFSRAINAGCVDESLDILEQNTNGALAWHPTNEWKRVQGVLTDIVMGGYADYLESTDALNGIRQFNRIQIICAVNHGPFGVSALNRFVERLLIKEGRIYYDHHLHAPWYDKRPVLITRNDYELGLFNGDIGIALYENDRPGGDLTVCFPDSGTGLKRVSPQRLPEHNTAHAITVHKSQGSEFDHVILLLPDRQSPVLSRELIYTAVTRAKEKVTIFGAKSIIEWAASRKISRTSGLRNALWGRQFS